MTNTAQNVIEVEGLTKIYGRKKVVDDVSLAIKPGEIFGFLGPNGSGKTTCIRMMCGLLVPDGGRGTCLGYDILTQSRLIKQHVGYMTQKFSYWTDMTIKENLDFTARIFQMKDRARIVEETIRNLGLKGRENQLTGALSGGWKQRLALAACLIHKPKLLLLDEPTAGVDPTARRDFWDELHQLAAQGISVLVSTHYMDEAERCHKLAYISYGKLLANGTAQEIIRGQGLATYIVRGGGEITEIASKLKTAPGVDQTILFGTSLHVSGKNAPLLESTLRQLPAPYVMEKADTSLEDVFVYMMNQSKDNFK